MIDGLIDGALKRRKVVLAVTLVMTFFGLLAYFQVPREAQPDITIPFVTVVVPYPGVSPEDAERLLVRPMEHELQSLQGLKEMNAEAREGVAVVSMEFEVNFNKDKVLEDVRAKVDLARSKFPPDALPPDIEESNISDEPVLGVVLSGPAPERTLYATARSLQDRLLGLPGVLSADIAGGREEVLEATIDPARMEAYNVTTTDLANVIGRNNQLVPAGDVQTRQGSFAVKLPGVVQSPKDILLLPIKKNGDKIVTVGDIGEVHRTFKEPTSIARYNGQRAFTLYVVKRPGSNLLDTIQAVRDTVNTEQKHWPPTIRSDYSFDQSEFIAHTLTMLESGLITATLLVMLIVIAALGVRQGIMVGAAIPTCFMITFLCLQAMHITLNQMVMFGLVLAVGILVDGGIVVVEYADRKMAEGLARGEAFAAAGKRMFWPVVNGTLTTLCAFLPFLFWNSIPGKFMSFLPLTLFFALSASIFVALIFTPALGSLVGRKQGVDLRHLAEIEKSEHGDPSQMTGFMGWYARTLTAAGRHPFIVTAGALAVMAAIIVPFAMNKHAVEFFLKQDPDHATVFVMARGNLSVEAANDLVRQVETRLIGVKGVRAIDVRAGKLGGGGPNAPPNDTIGRLQLEFVDFDGEKKLGLRGVDIVDDIRKRLGETPGVLTELRLPQSGPPQGKDVQIQLQSQDTVALNKAADLVRAHLAADPQIVSLEDTRTSPGIEWNFAVDRVAAGRYGVDVLSVGQAIQFVTDGILVGKFRPDDAADELDIRVRFPPDARNLSAFDKLKISTPSGPVPASYFVKMAPAQQVTRIARRDAQRLVVVQANVQGMAPNQKIDQLRPWLKAAAIDPSVRWKFRGADEEGQKAGVFFVTAMGVTLFLMFMILLWQFNSFYGVVVTLSAVVLTIMGVLLGVDLNLFHTFDYISVIMMGTGIVALAGVVVGHNIVLVDTFYQLRRAGYEADDAAVRAATQRFRPVMLTTVVTVIGLLPMMFQMHPDFRNGGFDYKAPGSEWWVQLSATVVWGLSFATLLTLFLTPAALAAPKALSRSLGLATRPFRGAFPARGRRPGLTPPPPFPEAAE
ncbi:efflux RND transporter permease subunit [Caulobacter sp. KR2-114]|uniref:efflux RND transporter permease subunit n=1 Tax=Caulobacter sp. KR2-114 TaxID=3400912 RepID=UPI003C0FE82A